MLNTTVYIDLGLYSRVLQCELHLQLLTCLKKGEKERYITYFSS